MQKATSRPSSHFLPQVFNPTFQLVGAREEQASLDDTLHQTTPVLPYPTRSIHEAHIGRHIFCQTSSSASTQAHFSWRLLWTKGFDSHTHVHTYYPLLPQLPVATGKSKNAFFVFIWYVYILRIKYTCAKLNGFLDEAAAICAELLRVGAKACEWNSRSSVLRPRPQEVWRFEANLQSTVHIIYMSYMIFVVAMCRYVIMSFLPK